MNQSEIAERAAREIQSSCLGIDDEMGIVIFEAEKAKAIVERAIAESRSGPQCDCYAMFGQPHFHDCPAGLWRDVPAQYKENRWRFDHDERNSTFFVHSGGHRICDAEDSEVASAICNAFNISFSKKPEIAESQAPQPPCESNSITYRAPEVVSDEPEPEKCPTCNGYHLGGCHRKAELGDGEPSRAPQTRFAEFDDADHPCNKWWQEHGQYMMSGGGRKEFVWACRGWIAREQFGENVNVTGERESGAAQEVSPPSPVRRFPIIGGPSIPWEVIEPHERQAQSNHDQTLRRLAERGGLSPAEAWFVLNDANWEAGTDWKKADEDGRALLNSINLRYERNRAEGDTREIAALPKDGRWNAALDKAAEMLSRMEVIAGQPRATVEKAVVEIRKLKEITALRGEAVTQEKLHVQG